MAADLNFNSAGTNQINEWINTAKNFYESSTTTPKTFGASGSSGDAYKNRIQTLVSVLQKRVNENPATTMAEINVDYTNTEKEIEVAKADLEAAKTRVESLRKPDEQSYYESWFPINRPLKRSSIFIVLIIGIFLYILSFMIAIRTLGINIDVSFMPPPLVLIQLSRLFPWQSLVLIGILIVIATLALLRKI
jgi:hypothetical protein